MGNTSGQLADAGITWSDGTTTFNPGATSNFSYVNLLTQNTQCSTLVLNSTNSSLNTNNILLLASYGSAFAGTGWGNGFGLTDALSTVVGSGPNMIALNILKMGNYPINFGTNNSVRMTISGSGVTIPNLLNANSGLVYASSTGLLGSTNLSVGVLPMGAMTGGVAASYLTQTTGQIAYTTPSGMQALLQIALNAGSTAVAASWQLQNDGTPSLNAYMYGSAVNTTACGITTNNLARILGSTGNALLIDVTNDYPIVFGTNDTERARINASGLTVAALATANTGIVYAAPTTGLLGATNIAAGTIPMGSATTGLAASVITQNAGKVGIGTASPGSTLHVNGRQTLDDGGNFELMANGLSGSSDTYLANGYAGRIEYNKSVGSWFFETAVSGTAGADTTYNKQMTILNGGFVGIGTTSPQCLLHVNGSIAFGQATILTSQTSYTVGADDVTIIYNYYSLSVTLPNASSFTGRILNFVSDAGAATCSATSVANNVIPIFSTTAGNVICASNNYGWCTIQSDGTYWRQIARGN